jgi:hemolysin activation/secretion protein
MGLLFLTLSRFSGVAAEPGSGSASPGSSATQAPVVLTNSARRFEVRAYAVKGDTRLIDSEFTSVLARAAGTNVGLADIVQAVSELQLKYSSGGYTNVTIALAPEQITNGVVTLNVFRGATPQILVDGRRVSASKGDLGAARPGATNAPPGFLVRAYEVHGDTLLTTETLSRILKPHTGTNITVADIIKAGSDLQMEYRNRGFATVKVVIPPQKIDTNAMVKIEILKGRLAEVDVIGNRYFSSNNVMRALPSLHTNMILVDAVFQSELDRANANQDRQIYAELQPGPTEGTSILDLKVKDRLPLHAKVDFNNQNSPGTPDLRLNTSMVYNNLWQLEHSIGVQYGFSPTQYKTGDRWEFYDQPLVANYGGFYRLPLGNPEPVAATIARSPGSFGYSEATRKFNLPAPSGQAELNFFASRSAIDTGLETLLKKTLYNEGGNSLFREDVQQDFTINESLGSRLTLPSISSSKFQSGFTLGPDYKRYQLISAKTNNFTLTSIVIDTIGGGQPVTNINVSYIHSPVPTTIRTLNYVPLSLHYNAGLRDSLGVTTFGLGLNVNAWYSGTKRELQNITGSGDSSGRWVTLTPSLGRDFIFHTNWTLSLNASGQWSDEPLISNEQFGVGGIGSVRGYHEGEVFGNDGWWLTAEQKTPPYVVGRAFGQSLLSVRASIYMGYGQVFETSPNPHQDLWGVGFGGVASIGSYWEARFLCSWPLIGTSSTREGQPRFDFSLSAQF